MSEIDEDGLLLLGEDVDEEFGTDETALWEDVDLEALGAEQDLVQGQEVTSEDIETEDGNNALDVHISTDAHQDTTQEEEYEEEVLGVEECYDDDDSDEEERTRDRFHNERTNLPQKTVTAAIPQNLVPSQAKAPAKQKQTLNTARYGPTASPGTFNQPRQQGPFVTRALNAGRRNFAQQPPRFIRNTRAQMPSRMMNPQGAALLPHPNQPIRVSGNQPGMQPGFNRNHPRMQHGVLYNNQPQLVPRGANVQPQMYRQPAPQQQALMQPQPQIIQPLLQPSPRNAQPARPVLMDASPPPHQRRTMHINPNFKGNLNFKPLREQSLEEAFGFPVPREEANLQFKQENQFSQGPGIYGNDMDMDYRNQFDQPPHFQPGTSQASNTIVIQPQQNYPNNSDPNFLNPSQFSPGIMQPTDPRFISPTSQPQNYVAQHHNVQMMPQDNFGHPQQTAFAPQRPRMQQGNNQLFQPQFVSTNQPGNNFAPRNEFVSSRPQQQQIGANQGDNFGASQLMARPVRHQGISPPQQHQQQSNWRSPPDQLMHPVNPNQQQHQRPNFNPRIPNQPQMRPGVRAPNQHMGQPRPNVLQARVPNVQNAMRAKSKALLNKARAAKMNRGGGANVPTLLATPTGAPMQIKKSVRQRLGAQKAAPVQKAVQQQQQTQAQAIQPEAQSEEAKKKADRAARFAITSAPIRKQGVKRISTGPAEDSSPPKQPRASFTITRTVNTGGSQSHTSITQATAIQPKAVKSESNINETTSVDDDIDAAYLAQLEAQKRKREEILRRKEQNRLKRAAESAGVETTTAGNQLVATQGAGDQATVVNQAQQLKVLPSSRQVVQGNQQQKMNLASQRGGAARGGMRGGMRGRGGRQVQPRQVQPHVIAGNEQQNPRRVEQHNVVRTIQQDVQQNYEEPVNTQDIFSGQESSPQRTVLMSHPEGQNRIVLPSSNQTNMLLNQGYKVRLTNISPGTSPQHLLNIAKQCGHVLRCQLSKSKTSAMVTFQTPQQAAYFAQKWDGKFLNNKLIRAQVMSE